MVQRLLTTLGWLVAVGAAAGCARALPSTISEARRQSAVYPRSAVDSSARLQRQISPASSAVASDTSPHRATLTRYCLTCHNERLRTAGLTLNPEGLQQVGASVEVWEKVVNKLRSAAMPPPGAPRPDQAAINGLAAWLEGALNAEAETRPDPGRTAVFHRLNRAEYRNALRDLLALEVDVASQLPADDIDEQGFDNMADVLSVSPALLERYLSAARKTARLAVGRAPLAASVEEITRCRSCWCRTIAWARTCRSDRAAGSPSTTSSRLTANTTSGSGCSGTT